MKILLFGGTTEGRELSCRLAEEGFAVTVCVATPYGAEEQGERENVTVKAGRLSVPEMELLLKEHDVCIDATHPYATEVTEHIREACAGTGVAYRRVLREACTDTGEQNAQMPQPAESVSDRAPDVVYADRAAEAARYLAERNGNVLLTTGAKELHAYDALDRERLFVRTLPSHESLDACEAAGIPHRNIIAMQGPFCEELNEGLLKQYDIAYLVTKDGGETGGFPEKLRAAHRLGVQVLVIARPREETDAVTPEELLRELRKTAGTETKKT